MLFSILIPVYNTEKYLGECINSIMRQSVQDFEIILCDDCSQDDSWSLCMEIAKKYPSKIKVIRNENNLGQLLTRRKLFAASQGNWIFCVDSDDLMADNALEKLISVIELHNPDLIAFNLECFHLDGHIEHFRPSLKPNFLYDNDRKSEVYAAIYENSYLNSLCTKVFKRAIVDVEADYSTYCNLTIGEDLFQSYPLFDKAESIYYLNESLYQYRKNSGGMTSSFEYDFYVMRKPLWKRENFYLEKWKLPKEVLEKANNKRVREIVGYARRGTEQYGDEWLSKTAKLIAEDGILETSLQCAKPQWRYSLYSRLLLGNIINLFCRLSALENWIVSRKLL